MGNGLFEVCGRDARTRGRMVSTDFEHRIAGALADLQQLLREPFALAWCAEMMLKAHRPNMTGARSCATGPS